MKYTVLSLFPEIINAFFANSIIAKAMDRGIIEYNPVNIRDFALDKHKTCDDAPYGGGPGMLMLAEPLARALEFAGANAYSENFMQRRIEPLVFGSEKKENIRVIYLSPSGQPFTQEMAKELACEKELILVCGRYEGIDQRIIDRYIDDEISIGDYILSSGEAAALAVIDATYRLVDGVICPESVIEESFSDGLLEYPQFTRPEVFDTIKVPEVLLSGHHEKIRLWRLEKKVEKTLLQRPDLIKQGRELGIFNKEINNLIDRLTNS